MDYLKEFVVPFVGLKIGQHQFDFEVDRKFFDSFEYSELHDGNIKIACVLEKQERMLIWDFHFTGSIKVNCDRCFDEFDLPVDGKERLIVKFGNEAIEESDEVVVIPESDYQFDLSHYIFEFINLILPYKKVHGEDENGNSLCNQDIVEKIEEHSEEETTDPRWDALKKLKEKE